MWGDATIKESCSSALSGIVLLFLLRVAFWMYDEVGAGTACLVGVLGLLVVSYFLVRAQKTPHATSNMEQINQAGEHADSLRLVLGTIRLGLLISASDGEISPEEIQALRTILRGESPSPQYDAWLDENIANAAHHPDIDRAYAEIRQIKNPEARRLVLIAVLAVAAANGEFSPNEINTYFTIAAQIGMDAETTEALLREFLGVSHEEEDDDEALTQAYGTLGLTPEATWSEVRSTYRKLAQHYHPDKVAALGPSFVQVAEEHMKKLNIAYSLLERHLKPS